MNEKREEIRWKFQILLENLREVKGVIRNDRKIYEGYVLRKTHNVETIRNHWFVIIGLIITISIPAIISFKLDTSYYAIPISAGVGAFGLFFYTNIKLDQIHVLLDSFEVKYYGYEKELGLITTFIQEGALIESFTEEHFEKFYHYVSIYGNAVNYQIEKFKDEKSNLKSLDKEFFRRHYDMAKDTMEKNEFFKNTPGFETIKQFVDDFKNNV